MKKRRFPPDPNQPLLPLRFYVEGPHGTVEVDHTVASISLPGWRGQPHPNPQHWRVIRLACFERDGWTCRLCGADWPLLAHHVTYARFGDEQLADLTSICRPCHEQYHGITPERKAA